MKSMTSTRRGVLYIVTGEQEYYDECKRSVDSLVASGYGGPILVLTDKPELARDIRPREALEVRQVGVEGNSPFERSRILKTSLFARSPFEETLFLDTDTRVLMPIDPIWAYLEEASLVLGHDKFDTLGDVLRNMVLNRAYSLEEATYTRALCPPCAAFLNSGVMLFRRDPDAGRLFENWEREWARFRGRDQLALMRAISLCGIEPAVLPLAYNSHAASTLEECEVKISHYHLVKPGTRAGSRGKAGRAARALIKAVFRPLLPAALKTRLKALNRALRHRDQETIYRAVLAHELRDEILGGPAEKADG
jgi:hypothetical protein